MISKTTLETLVEELAVTDAEEAMSNAIIDGLIYEKDFENSLKAALELNKYNSINSVEFYEMNTQIKPYENDTKDRNTELIFSDVCLFGHSVIAEFANLY